MTKNDNTTAFLPSNLTNYIQVKTSLFWQRDKISNMTVYGSKKIYAKTSKKPQTS